jgi:hypothetical protein
MIEPLFPRNKLMNEMNMAFTIGLFHEFNNQSAGAVPVYTLKTYDWKGHRSMYQVYMGCSSEYEAAMTLLGDWTHWRRLCECSWFKPYIDSWREEVLVREAALGKAVVIQAAEDGNVAAAKELMKQLDKKQGPGRPSKVQKENTTRIMNDVDKKVVNLLSRMGNV